MGIRAAEASAIRYHRAAGVVAKVKITDKDKGFAKFVGSLGEMGNITIGVQGKDATKPHPEDPRITVGELAAMHELGLRGQKARSWLTRWVDENTQKMLQLSARQLKRVLKGDISRNKALIEMGYKWTEQMRQRMWDGKVTPDIAESTKRKKKDDRPLVEYGILHDSITYKVYLPQFKSIRNTQQRAAARRK